MVMQACNPLAINCIIKIMPFFSSQQSGWTAGHVAQHQHYLNIFEVLSRVTTCVESWEEIESYDEEVERPQGGETTTSRPSGLESHRMSGVPRLELEKPDMMGEHPVTDTEEDQGEVEYTAIPPSPMFSRTGSQQAVGEERIERVEVDRTNQMAAVRRQLSNDNTSAFVRGGGTRLSDKQSIVSGMLFFIMQNRPLFGQKNDPIKCKHFVHDCHWLIFVWFGQSEMSSNKL